MQVVTTVGLDIAGSIYVHTWHLADIPIVANERPILARTLGLDVWTCTPKREAPPKRGDAERIYLRTFRLPADSLPLSETIS
jgi:hypothetical protein